VALPHVGRIWQARPVMRPGDELRLFLDEAVPRFRAAGVEPGSFEERMAWQQILAEGGWVAPAWPVEHGGRGLTTADRIECDEILAASGTPLIAGTLGVKNVGPTMAMWGTDEQKAHLPRILDGTELWCQGFSEPDAGSDLASLRTRAVIDGDDFVIDGEKVWTTQGLRATHCELLARTDPDATKHAGISALLIPLVLPGIERRPIRQITGDIEFASMSFQEVRVPRSCLLGPLHEGWKVTTSTLAHERAGVAMFATRHEAEVLALVDSYAGHGAPALDPVARQLLMRRYIDGRLIGLVGRKILATLVQGGTPGPEQQLIKLSWSLGEQRLGEARATLAGPALMTGGAPVAERALLQSRASTIAAGTTEVMKNLIAERVLGLPRR
jgi:alkylation response protein AidB-like acyl-CoA dehydrogenase